MIKRKIQAKDLEIGMDFVYTKRKGKYVISKIWDILYYDHYPTNGYKTRPRVRIYFNNQKSRHARADRLFEIFVQNPICIPRLKTDSSKLKTYFENLEAYKIGSTICRCGIIVPKGSIWHGCDN